jgi:hypothetical protein
MYMKKLTQKIWEIRKKKKDDFFPQTNPFCDWCGYKTMCSKFNPGHKQVYELAVKSRKASKKRVKMGVKTSGCKP